MPLLENRRARIELLEGRLLLTAAHPADAPAAGSFSFNAGTLTVTGTLGDDTANLTVSGGQTLIVDFNDSPQFYPLTGAMAVSNVVLQMGAGDDSVNIGFGVPPVLVQGGPGNETIIASNDADNTLRGGQGTDSISVDGEGNNVLDGGAAPIRWWRARGPTHSPVMVAMTVWSAVLATVCSTASAGNDTVVAGTGNSTLQCGTGTDSLDGSGGGDCIINAGTGADTIVARQAFWGRTDHGDQFVG